MSKDWVKDINEMHAKFGVHEWVKKAKDSGQLHKLEKFLEFRLNFLKEELEETRKAALLDYEAAEVVDGLIAVSYTHLTLPTKRIV